MLTRTITYEDYNGVERKETFYFNLNKAELTQMNMSVAGSMQNRLQRIVDSNDGVEIMKVFREILKASYGVKSEDGRRFIKNEEVWKEFEESPAFSVIFMELVTDADAASKFIEAVLPRDLVSEIPKNVKGPVALPTNEDN